MCIVFDVESNGSIKSNQLIMLMSALKQYPTEKELEDIIKEADINNEGKIYFNQFLKMIAKRLRNIKEDEDKYLKSLFSSLDPDNNGLISIREIKYIVTHSNENISEKDFEIIMKEADTDGDGLISLDEFMTIMKN